MRSDAATVDDFLMEQPEQLRDALAQIRDMIGMEAPDALEEMKLGETDVLPGWVAVEYLWVVERLQ
jgi:hypothetical protein